MTNVKNVTQRIKDVSQVVAHDLLSWSNGDYAFVTKYGEEEIKSKITFPADGRTIKNSTDAINGSQFY